MQNKASVVIGLSGRGLKDLDLFSKSDPYVVISRQTQPGGSFVQIRKSETINNNLNPDWKDFLIYESELGSGSNDDIQIEVFDDDGKPGKDRNDESIGFVKTRVSSLSLPPPRQHCPTLFSLAQGWSIKASTNPQVLFQDKQTLRGRTARV